MSTETTTAVKGTTVAVYVSDADDHAVVVQVDTTPYTGRVRIYVNDSDPVYDEDPELESDDNRTPTQRALADIGKLWEDYDMGDDVADTLEAVQDILTQLKAASA